MPALKSQLGTRNQTLTDLAPAEEKVRNYPADRAYRVVHGLIDLLEAFKRSVAREQPWLIVCDHFDRASHIGRRFFAELMARRGEEMDLHFVLAVHPGAGETAAAAFAQAERRTLELEPVAAEPLDREALQRTAAELEARVGSDKDLIEANVSDCCAFTACSATRGKSFAGNAGASTSTTRWGFYEDALTYGNEVWRQLDLLQIDEDDLRWAIFVKLFMSNVGLQRADDAFRLTKESRMLERENIALPRRAQLYYLLSMLYVRYFKPRDLDRGQEYLELGLADLEAARGEMTDEDYYFYVVFNRNGLALVRHFQGRFAEAIELCRQGFDQLERHLAGEKHKLHRSVLLYNIGQVYVAIGDAEKGIEYYSKAMAMDPGYSEYFNERASLYLLVGNYAASRKTSCGPSSCRRRIPRWDQPGPVLSQAGILGRGHRGVFSARSGPAQPPGADRPCSGLDALERIDEALADYSRALELEPNQWMCDQPGGAALPAWRAGAGAGRSRPRDLPGAAAARPLSQPLGAAGRPEKDRPGRGRSAHLPAPRPRSAGSRGGRSKAERHRRRRLSGRRALESRCGAGSGPPPSGDRR